MYFTNPFSTICSTILFMIWIFWHKNVPATRQPNYKIECKQRASLTCDDLILICTQLTPLKPKLDLI